jgi:hypothetical protein
LSLRGGHNGRGPKRVARQLQPAAEIVVAAVVFGRFHRSRAALTGLSRSGRGAVICFGVMQRLTFMQLGLLTLLRGSILGGAACIVARLLRLATRGDRTRACHTRRPGRATGILTAG